MKLNMLDTNVILVYVDEQWKCFLQYGTRNQKTSDSVSASKLQEDPDAIIEIEDDIRSDFNNRSHVKSERNQSDLRSCTSAGY